MTQKQFEYALVLGDGQDRFEFLSEVQKQAKRGFVVKGVLPGEPGSLWSVLMEREVPIDEAPVPEGQMDKPRRTLWLKREHGDLYFIEKWRGIYDYENPTLPCLDKVRTVPYNLDGVLTKWERKMALAATFLMAKHEGVKEGEEFQFWLPGLTDDEELLK